MALRGAWRDNQELAQWEAVIGSYHAVARLDSIGRYVAFLEDEASRGTDHYAPTSFSDPEEAKAWCEAEIERLEAERTTARPDPDNAFKRQISDQMRDRGTDIL